MTWRFPMLILEMPELLLVAHGYTYFVQLLIVIELYGGTLYVTVVKLVI